MPNTNIITMDGLFTGRCNMDCKYCFEEKKLKIDMDFDKLKTYLYSNPCFTFFPFGGEPLLNLDFNIKLAKLSDELVSLQGEECGSNVGVRYIITNGTLIKHNIDKIKENGFTLQISLDGCKPAHNINRTYANGKGTWNDVVEGIILTAKNNIPFKLHGVCGKNNIKYIFRSSKFYFRLNLWFLGKEKAIEKLGDKIIFFMFEQNWNDNDVNIVIEQFYKFAKWIFKLDSKVFSIYDKKEAFKRFFCREIMKTCSCGFNLRAIDPDFNIYPCHRFVMIKDKEKYSCGNLFDIKSTKNFELYNSLFKMKTKQRLYATNNIEAGTEESKWFYWCPATNLETSGNPQYQNDKYNRFITEIKRAVKEMEELFIDNRR